MAKEKETVVDEESTEKTAEETVETKEDEITVEDQLKNLEDEVNTWKLIIIKCLLIWKILRRDYRTNMLMQ